MLNTLRKNIVATIASRHVVGSEIADALPVCRWAKRMGYHSILSPWARPEDTHRVMFQRYRAALEAIPKEDIDCYLSVKLESIGYDGAMFEELVEAARLSGVRLHLDSLGPDSAPLNFGFLEKAAARYDNLGCTLPSRWRRSLDDAERAIEMNLSVRIVKGQWEDPGAVKIDSRKNYIALVGKLAGRARHVGTATHDLALGEKALGILSAAGTHCEFEQLSTLPLNGMKAVAKHAYAYRLYVAYGSPGIPYNTKFILSRPGMVAWVLTDFTLDLKKPWAKYE